MTMDSEPLVVEAADSTYALSPVHPGVDAAVSIGKFLQVNPFGQGYGFTLRDASADVLKSETGRRCDHQTIGFAW